MSKIFRESVKLLHKISQPLMELILLLFLSIFTCFKSSHSIFIFWVKNVITHLFHKVFLHKHNLIFNVLHLSSDLKFNLVLNLIVILRKRRHIYCLLRMIKVISTLVRQVLIVNVMRWRSLNEVVCHTSCMQRDVIVVTNARCWCGSWMPWRCSRSVKIQIPFRLSCNFIDVRWPLVVIKLDFSWWCWSCTVLARSRVCFLVDRRTLGWGKGWPGLICLVEGWSCLKRTHDDYFI